MPVLLDKFCIFKIIFKVGHLLDDLPVTLWLGMVPTVIVESNGSGGGCPSSYDSVGVEYSSLLSTSEGGIPAGRT